MSRQRWFLAVPAVVSLVGCDPPSRPTTETPDKQFTAENIHLTELGAAGVSWRGTAAAGSGDLREHTLVDLRLTRVPSTANERTIHVAAPRGELDLASGSASFEAPVVTDELGSVLTATAAAWSDHTQTLTARGPLVLTSASLTAHAVGAVVHVREDRVDVTGPVEGRFDPSP